MANIRKRAGKWQVQVRRQGHRPTSKTFTSKLDAVAWGRNIEAQLDRGESPDRIVSRPLITLRKLLEKYRDTVVPHKRSATQEKAALKVFLREPMCTLSVADIGPEHFAEYRDRRLLTVKPSTVCRTLAIVQHAFKTAIYEWRIPLKVNPVKDVGRPRLNNQRVRRLSESEVEAIKEGLKKTKNPYIAPAVALAIETGMRRSEILNLTWSNVDLGASLAFLPLTKNGKPRTVPLSPLAVIVLNEVAKTKSCEHVFPVSRNALRLAWDRLLRRCNVHDLRFHDLRHEAISRFFEIGLAMPEVALISGHQDARMLMRYTHVSAKSVADKLKSFSKK